MHLSLVQSFRFQVVLRDTIERIQLLSAVSQNESESKYKTHIDHVIWNVWSMNLNWNIWMYFVIFKFDLYYIGSF